MEGLLKHRTTTRDQNIQSKQDQFTNFNATKFFDTKSDIYIFRVTAEAPSKMLTKKSKDRGGVSSMSQKMVYLGPSGDVI